jgi:hypothetical protein
MNKTSSQAERPQSMSLVGLFQRSSIMGTKSSSIYFDRAELRLVEAEVSFTGVPVQALLNIKNGASGDITVTSKLGAAAGNATSMTFTMSTNAASVSFASPYGIGVDLHKDGTNAFSDTTASNVKTLLEANTNIAGIISVATNAAGIMATAAKAFLATGDDKLTITSRPDISLTRNSIGNLTLQLNGDKLLDYAGCIADVSCTTAGTFSGIAKVEVKAVDKDTFTISMFDQSAALANVDSASTMHLWLIGQNSAL